MDKLNIDWSTVKVSYGRAPLQFDLINTIVAILKTMVLKYLQYILMIKKMKYWFFLMIVIWSCKARVNHESQEDICSKCWRQNIMFIDTLEKDADIDSMACRKFRDRQYNLLYIGLDYYSEENYLGELIPKSVIILNS